MSQLTGKQWQQLTNALIDAFPTYNDLRNMLMFQMDVNLAVISGSGALDDVVFEVIQWTEARDRSFALIAAARQSNPTNELLMVAASSIGATVRTPGRAELERLLGRENQMLDVAQFLRRLGELEGQICRIEIGQLPCAPDNPDLVTCGTGFLVGPDVVLTNYHVIEAVRQGEYNGKPVTAADVVCRFDYRQLADGHTLNEGKTYRLADEWFIAGTCYSEHDRLTEALKQGLPAADELDFALLRLAAPAGDEKLGSDRDRAAPARGYVNLPAVGAVDYSFGDNKVMYIVQHPLGQPLKLTANVFRSYNDNDTRITYKNDTEAGSSGSPCFNARWDLVAVHHSGDSADNPDYNEGIPINRIVDYLAQHDLLAKLQPAGSRPPTAGTADPELDF